MLMPTILLAGLLGAGKSTVASILTEHFGLRSVNVGDVLADHLIKRHSIAWASRLEIGPAFLRVHRPRDIHDFALAEAQERRATVLDGVRLASTCNELRLSLPDLEVWFIEAESELREERLKGADIPSAPGRKEPFDYQDQQLLIRPLADLFLSNSGSLAELVERIRARYRALRS